jgi:hypothetical protein
MYACMHVLMLLRVMVKRVAHHEDVCWSGDYSSMRSWH